jgi:hypothetical protein
MAANALFRTAHLSDVHRAGSDIPGPTEKDGSSPLPGTEAPLRAVAAPNAGLLTMTRKATDRRATGPWSAVQRRAPRCSFYIHTLSGADGRQGPRLCSVCV